MGFWKDGLSGGGSAWWDLRQCERAARGWTFRLTSSDLRTELN